ncbi:MAG: methionine--tRNA ligase [Candidatus Diapherotrites archaeon]|nr:methionine--tRNA ligase [Candidatus Diapherotrites archaeon]
MFLFRYLVTSALPYINARPHLGHLIGSLLPPDIYVRYLRLKGEEAIYICGTDEHGTATEIAAEKAGVTPQEWCDRYYKLHKEDYEWFLLDFTGFGRTSSPSNHELTQYVFKKLYKQGYIFEKSVRQFYCPNCKRFLPDRFVKGICPHCGAEATGDQCESCGKLLEPEELLEPRCAVCGSEPVLKESKHLFLDLPKFAPKLKQWIKANKHWPDNVRNWALSLIPTLKPRGITRDLKWGVKVPLKGFEDKVFYVWFDAPIGYISITKDFVPNWRKWWTSKDTRLVHFLGKDNIPFHTIIFPSCLMAAGFILPYNVIAAEYLNYEGKKFSKSKGVGVTLEDARKLPYPPDYWRYALVSMSPETHDSDFSWKGFQESVNELADVLGNFVNRTMVLTYKYFDGKVPEPGNLSKEDKRIVKMIERAPTEIAMDFERARFREAQKSVLELAREGNAYLNDQEPWKNEKVRANVLFLSLNICRSLSILFSPVIPQLSQEIWELLGEKGRVKEQRWDDAGKLLLKPGKKLKKPKILVKKIDDKEVSKYEEKFGGAKMADTVSFEEFKKVDLRAALVKEVEDVSGADKLYRIALDVGELGSRTVVAGLRKYYKKEELKGKLLVYVSNLQPKKIFGLESRGMLLAGESDGKVSLAILDRGIKPGSRIY